MEGVSTVTAFENATAKPMTSNLTEVSSEFDNLLAVTQFIGRYYIWVIFAFGFPGNLISLFIIVRMSRHRLMTPLLYVALLAVVDNIAIILKIIVNQTRYNQYFMNAPACKILYFLGLTLAAYPNWILIVMSAERFTAVRFPMKVGLIWSVKRAVIIISSVLLFFCLVYFHIFFSVISKNGSCTRNPKFDSFFLPWWFLISFFLYAGIPAVTLTIFNILIIRLLQKSTIRRKQLLSMTDQSVNESRRQEKQVTIMLVTLAVVFILLTIPRCVYIIIWNYWKPEDDLGQIRKSFIDAVTSCLADFNHAVNFYLYFVSARKFRNVFMQMIRFMFPCVKKRHYKATIVITQTSDLPVAESST